MDIKPQKNFPFAFLRADVLSLDVRFLRYFDAIHASPPCQFTTALRHAPGTRKDHLNLIPDTRALLQAAGRPYVIENVEGAREHLVDPVCLCGTMFGLRAGRFELQRHRLFETSFLLRAPCACQHSGAPVVGVYGGHARVRAAKHGGRGTRDDWGPGGHKPIAAQAMGMSPAEKITLGELSEAIPPAFTNHIGRVLLGHLRAGLQVERAA